MSLITIGKHGLRVLDPLSRRLSLLLHNKSSYIVLDNDICDFRTIYSLYNVFVPRSATYALSN